MQPTSDVINRVAEWRQKAAAGTLSLAEMTEAVKFLRQSRMSAAQTAKETKSTSKKKPAADTNAMLDELGI